MTHADVLVIGAGPAGSLAALTLARAGVRVRLVDRARFPREKLCGDTINPGALALLDRAELGAQVRERAFATTGMIVTGPGGTAVAADYPAGLTGAALTRRELDLLLVEAATRAGVRFDAGVIVRAPLVGKGHRLAGVRVAAGAADHDIYAKVIIAADGRHSRLAFHLGLARYAAEPKRWAFGAYYIGVDGMGTRGEMHVRSDSYLGLAPLPGGVTNVCVVRELHTPLRAHRVDPEEMVTEAIAQDPQLRERFARAQPVSEVVSLGPLAIDARAAGYPGLLLAGDAAGFIDPITGDGLRFAMRGGELAAVSAMRELETGQPAHHELAVARQREFSPKWRVDRALRWLTARGRPLAVASALARHWPGPFVHLVRVCGDCALAATDPAR